MRYLIGLLLTIGLLILLIVIIVQHGGKGPAPQTTKTLQSYSTTSAVARLTNDGPINAAQDHKQIQITVGQNNVVIETISGYNNSVTSQQTYANTEAGYYNFLSALHLAGFTKNNPDPTLKNETGYCPLGNRYVFEFMQDGKKLIRSWATSCGKPSTYLGALSLSLTLFQAQVPDYNLISSQFLNTQH
ncbi:MAG: hypothetical protein ABI602_03735 [Candidatus Saccharibacteria bacterium]